MTKVKSRVKIGKQVTRKGRIMIRRKWLCLKREQRTSYKYYQKSLKVEGRIRHKEQTDKKNQRPKVL